jgi:hypothetical protein
MFNEPPDRRVKQPAGPVTALAGVRGGPDPGPGCAGLRQATPQLTRDAGWTSIDRIDR